MSVLTDLIEDDLPIAVRLSDDGELYEFGVVWKDSFIVLIATKRGYVDVVHERVAAEAAAIAEIAAERVRAERQAKWEAAEDARLEAEAEAAKNPAPDTAAPASDGSEQPSNGSGEPQTG